MHPTRPLEQIILLEQIFEFVQLVPIVPMKQIVPLEQMEQTVPLEQIIRICSIGSNLIIGIKNCSTRTNCLMCSPDLRKHIKSSHEDLLLDLQPHGDLKKNGYIHSAKKEWQREQRTKIW